MKWIKTSDELPEIRTSVLVYTLGAIRVGALGDSQDWWDLNKWVRFRHVSHWMPLPAPPGEGIHSTNSEDTTHD